MRALRSEENPEEVLLEFDKTQIEYALNFIQDHPTLIKDEDLMLNIGLSLNTIKRYISQLNLEVESDSWKVSKHGLEELRSAVQSLNQLQKYDFIANYYKLISPQEYLSLMSLSWQQFCGVTGIMERKGRILQKRIATKAHRYLVDKYPDLPKCTTKYRDPVVSRILNQM